MTFSSVWYYAHNTRSGLVRGPPTSYHVFLRRALRRVALRSARSRSASVVRDVAHAVVQRLGNVLAHPVGELDFVLRHPELEVTFRPEPEQLLKPPVELSRGL